MTSSDEEEKRYDRVQIVRPDGTTIEGHDAVTRYFEQEEQICNEHGATLNFEVFRMNLQAHSFEELLGPLLAEIKTGSDFVSGADTVADVKDKLLPLLRKNTIAPDTQEHVTLHFASRLMKNDGLFYADHFMMLPAWIQVFIHRGEANNLQILMSELRKSRSK